MRISFLNIQNLYFRDLSLEGESPKPTLNWLSEMDGLMEKLQKGKKELHRIEELSLLLGFQRIAKQRYGILRNRAGQLYLKEGVINHLSKAGPASHWEGWLRINNQPVSYDARMQKIRLLAELNSDLIILQEVEDRYALELFLKEVMKEFPEVHFPIYHVLEGKDIRGVEQAILCANELSVLHIAPVLSPRKSGQALHYRLYHEQLGKISVIAMYISCGMGERAVSEAERNHISGVVASYYKELVAKGEKNIAVVGTLRTPGYCYSLGPLLRQTDLKDISSHKMFSIRSGKKSRELYYPDSAIKEVVGKQDFFLLNPHFSERVKSAGLIWSGRFWNSHANLKSNPSIITREQQASDHPGLWIEV